jgi:hypothetical protein
MLMVFLLLKALSLPRSGLISGMKFGWTGLNPTSRVGFARANYYKIFKYFTACFSIDKLSKM